MIWGIIFIIVGAVMFMQFRKAQKRTQAILWMTGSAIFAIFGLINLLDAILQ